MPSFVFFLLLRSRYDSVTTVEPLALCLCWMCFPTSQGSSHQPETATPRGEQPATALFTWFHPRERSSIFHWDSCYVCVCVRERESETERERHHLLEDQEMELCLVSIKSVTPGRRAEWHGDGWMCAAVSTMPSGHIVTLGTDLSKRMLHCGRRMLLEHE